MRSIQYGRDSIRRQYMIYYVTDELLRLEYILIVPHFHILPE